MTSPVTRVAWVIRQRTTKAHIKGLLTALDSVGALDLAEVQLLAVSEERAVVLPDGKWRLPTGKVVDAGFTLTIDNLPPQGLLLVADDDPA